MALDDCLSRWNSLYATMNTLAARYEGAPYPRRTTMAALIKGLQAFAKDQFYFFYNSFQAYGEEHPLLNPPPPADVKYHPEFVLGAILDQVSFDMEVIQRAADQRCRQGPMRDTLTQADRYAWTLLESLWQNDRLITDGWMKDGKTTVLTYFQKSPSIRVIPYAPVALIGIPYSSIPDSSDTIVARECLAVPHEVGHYVFWRGKLQVEQEPEPGAYVTVARALSEQVARAVSDEEAWVKAWVEEVFADVFGYLRAGPVMAIGCEANQLEVSDTKFLEDDGEHPVPAIRPYVYYLALGDNSVSQARIAQWEKKLGDRGIKFRFNSTPPTPASPGLMVPVDESKFRTHRMNGNAGQPETIGLSKTKRPLAELVEAVKVQRLPDIRLPDVSGSDPDLLSEFQDTIAATAKVSVPEVDLLEATGVWRKWWERQVTYTRDIAPPPSENDTNIILNDKKLETRQVRELLSGYKYETLKWVFSARGWATKGPQTVWD